MSELRHLPLKQLDRDKDTKNPYQFETLKQEPAPPHLRTYCECRRTNSSDALCYWNRGFCSLLQNPTKPLMVLDAILLNQVNFERALNYLLAYGRRKGWLR